MRRLPRLSRRLPALALALALAGCSSSPVTETPIIESLGAVADVVRSRTAGDAAPAPQLTRAGLDTVEGEFLQASIEKTGARAVLYVQADRRDDRPGRIVVWRTQNDVTLTVRDGVLIATRGLGEDLLSSNADVMVAALRTRRDATGRQRQVYAGLDNKAVPIEMACAIENMGRETITIVERAHVTDRLRQTCEGGGGRIVNDYWIDSRGPTVWASRQWAGPNIGYVRMRQLTP